MQRAKGEVLGIAIGCRYTASRLNYRRIFYAQVRDDSGGYGHAGGVRG
jgi:hypothetical protein